MRRVHVSALQPGVVGSQYPSLMVWTTCAAPGQHEDLAVALTQRIGAEQLLGQVQRTDLVLVIVEQCSRHPDHAVQLADVARPGIAEEELANFDAEKLLHRTTLTPSAPFRRRY